MTGQRRLRKCAPAATRYPEGKRDVEAEFGGRFRGGHRKTKNKESCEK
jgi:hypothetical protein